MALLQSERFEVTIAGSHSIIIPERTARVFSEAGHRRVQVHAFYKEQTLTFHGALRKYQGNYIISFGKRYQKLLTVSPTDLFKVQLIEDTTKYGVEMPEELSAVLETDPEAAELFEGFTSGKKRSLIYQILRIKNVQKRVDKALLLADNIKMGITDQKKLFKIH